MSAEPPFDPGRGWALAPDVALRPEPFGALAYHFGTRRLSFLKSTTLHDIVLRLAEEPSARAAICAACVDEGEVPAYERALERLAESGMIVARGAA